MGQMKLTIQHGDKLFEPPVEEGVKIEWERTGSPGKLTFTTLKSGSKDEATLDFQEGDAVCFYYDETPMFMGYVFTKKRDREHRIEVTCYDQVRYLKNKYTYVFERKTASQIIKALCTDLNLHTGNLEDTGYVIPAIAEENAAAIDIALSALEETLLNTGERFVIYDNFGKLEVKNCTSMISSTLIMEDTAENFDYSSSIDDETYNSVVLYYKEDDNKIQVYGAYDANKISKWGTLRYFEETKNKAIAQNKANALLKLYARRTRELKITGAFGDPTVRGGTLIPVKLNLGDTIVSNYMVVEKVIHNFENNHYSMDLTLDGYWDDGEVNVTVNSKFDTAVSSGGSDNHSKQSAKLGQHDTVIDLTGDALEYNKPPETQLLAYRSLNEENHGRVIVTYYDSTNTFKTATTYGESNHITALDNTKVRIIITPDYGYKPVIESTRGSWVEEDSCHYHMYITESSSFIFRWESTFTSRSGKFGATTHSGKFNQSTSSGKF